MPGVIRVFRAGPGAEFGNKDAQRFGEFLSREAGLDIGPVEAEKIVELAKPKSSPIHDIVFDRNARGAAHEYYLQRARHLVRHLVVTQEVDGQSIQTRAFHHVTLSDDGVRGYVAERVVWRNEEMGEQVVKKALRELETWRDRYAQYSVLQRPVALVDELLAEAA